MQKYLHNKKRKKTRFTLLPYNGKKTKFIGPNKLFWSVLIVGCLGFSVPLNAASYLSSSDSSFKKLEYSFQAEMKSLLKFYDPALYKFRHKIHDANTGFLRLRKEDCPVGALKYLVRKKLFQDSLNVLEKHLKIDVTLLRFKKGLELMRLIYEKILGLDHHFSTLKTYQNVMSLSNPHSYESFKEIKEVISARLNKKSAVKLPALWNTNPILSATYSIVASFVGDEDPKLKEKDLHEISCILDFTVRMSNDLSLIYYETEFLETSNISLKEDCHNLFEEYVKPISYAKPLKECRKEDDWEAVYEALGKYGDHMKTLVGSEGGEGMQSDLYKMQVDLEFSVDRLLDFINRYAGFIQQGKKYYQKFEIIIQNYANEESCATQLPADYEGLKKDIIFSIEKFEESYNIASLKGSKLKDLLYGSGFN